MCTESNSEDSEARRGDDDNEVEVDDVVDEEEADTDLETDRLLGQQRTDDQGFYDDKVRKMLMEVLTANDSLRCCVLLYFFF